MSKQTVYQSVATDAAKSSLQHHPARGANAISRLFLDWATPLMAQGNTRPLNQDDMWPMDEAMTCDVVRREFEASFKHTKSIPRTIANLFGWRLVVVALMHLSTLVATLYGPVVLQEFLAAMEKPTAVFNMPAVAQGISLLFVLRVASALLSAHANLDCQFITVNITAALQHLLLQKAMHLHAACRREKTTGEIANMFSTDILVLNQFALFSKNLVIVPIQIVVTLGMLYTVFGWVAFVALAAIALNILVNSFFSKQIQATVRSLMHRRDIRMKSVNEVFGAMQVIKLNAWEEKFGAKIAADRDAELASLWDFGCLLSDTATVTYLGPALVVATSLGVYTMILGQTLTPCKLFTALSLLNLLKIPTYQLPSIVMRLAQAMVSLQRFQDFFDLAEKNEASISSATAYTPSSCDVIVALKDAKIGWDASSTPLFENANLSVTKGQLVVVYGAVGEGKSSLCAALLGEMDVFRGSIFVGGRVAYFSQQPWLQNMTIRENILFGQPYDRVKYNRVIDACALTTDLALFPAGDRTEIGQKGVTLSGGQKARVSLARACYSDADVFILDSPLSAVDAIVQNELYHKCILGLLHHKTVILVTHSPEIIGSNFVDQLVEVKCGQLVSHAVERNPSVPMVSRVIVPLPCHVVSRRHFESSAVDVASFPMPSPAATSYDPLFTPLDPKSLQLFEDNESNGRLVEEETLFLGRVSSTVYRTYFSAIGGWATFMPIVISCALWQLLIVASDLWLNAWCSSSPEVFAPQSGFYLGIYAVLAMASAFAAWIQCTTTVRAGVAASRTLFDHMTAALLRAPMQFFDANPIGRILNRYSNDMATADTTLPLLWFNILPLLAVVAFGLGTALAVVRFYGLAALPLVYVYAKIGYFYIQPAREIERVNKSTKSPLLNLVAEAIDGVLVVRAFGHTRRFLRLHARNIDVNNQTIVAGQVLTQWCTLRVQLTTASILFLFMTAMVYIHAVLSPGMVGLALTYLLSNMGSIESIISMWTQLETSMVGPERISQYTAIKSEAPRVVAGAVAATWPARGDIHFDNISFRYKQHGVLVLKDVSVAIRSGEKIGIVGRTGAGKSSLAMALFRMHEWAAGSIKIDGVNIAHIGVKTLRRSLAIIPQLPVLFKGTLRSYLDPFGDFDDGELWTCLQKIKLADRIASVAGQLESIVEENGDNFSVGERQMLCMARALLRQARIVVMDEATAAIDQETDENLQRVIRSEFAASTVLTIAHRLDTVLDCDRILVFDAGRLVQCDTPTALVAQGTGTFFQLCVEGGYIDKIVAP
ncbi:Aste57867_14526 [Aphanomyces stellatus]|uniref:Aste57867_14526 protein n=1 Tax=Aphanomyces stellatus TaxID=120398 RepID=A0A485L1P9_9STRA|nr:hypothetical protein As57867_014472 [Aphanomyces stellatus]VFT91348.1 Aste57867_14526 [Aphanomyces stellatus]